MRPSLRILILITHCLLASPARSEPPGAAIYRKHCATCHGDRGQGVRGEYENPLVGDRSVKSLAQLIERTMPEEDESLCVGEDARLVAEFVHDAFYSPTARARTGLAGGARVELSRLTVPQFRNAIADLIASLDPGSTSPSSYQTGGLRGSYFSSDKMSKKHKHGLDRTDPVIDFDFGEGAPAAGIDPTQFSIAWEGSFVAPASGSYEFRVTTPNGVRLYVNADLKPGDRNHRDDSSAPSRVPLIDGWVSEGNQARQLSARTGLLGGRRYPIRLDYFKYKEERASIKLEWKPPHGRWSLLGNGAASPDPASRTLVVTTPFPADDRSLGYERGTAISKEWHAATTRATVEVADEISDRLDQFTGSHRQDPQRVQKLKDFAGRFAATAFRRPLDEAARQRFVEEPFGSTGNPETALRRSVLMALGSPRFLYPELPVRGAGPDAHTTASRLALYLWDSIPDRALADAAARGKLSEPGQVEAQARRMVGDPRAKEKLDGFFAHWLELEERDLTKDSELFPDFGARTIADLRHSLGLFIDQTVWGEKSDYRQLLLADHLLLNGELARFYGGDEEAEAFAPVSFDPQRRAGILTHPYLLSAFAYHDNTSPIHRGVFLTRNVVGRQLRPPPVAVAFKDDEFDPTLTMREKVTSLTRDSACMSCHSVINPLGFSLENFDALGRWRTTDNQKKIDAQSEYTTLEGDTITLRSARDIAEHAAASPAAHRAFITSLFHHTVKQAPAAYGLDTIEKLRHEFTASGFHIRNLLIRIATTTSRATTR